MSRPPRPWTGRAGRRSPSGSTSAPSISPSGTLRPRRGARSGASSSTPGRWRASWARAVSPRSSAGAATSATGPPGPTTTPSAAAPPSGWSARGPGPRCGSWTPLEGPYLGFLITHGESISIADYLSVREGEQVVYRPTVHYAYHPCNDAVLSLQELAGREWRVQPRWRQLRAEDIDAGMDELGVLLMGHARGAYWYGSRLTNEQAMRLAPHNNATKPPDHDPPGPLGVVWAMNHPDAGIVDPDEMDFQEVMEVALPYMGEMVGVYTDWTPLEHRGTLFPEDLDWDDPWQFKNIVRELRASDGALLPRLPAACSGSATDPPRGTQNNENQRAPHVRHQGPRVQGSGAEAQGAAPLYRPDCRRSRGHPTPMPCWPGSWRPYSRFRNRRRLDRRRRPETRPRRIVRALAGHIEVTNQNLDLVLRLTLISATYLRDLMQQRATGDAPRRAGGPAARPSPSRGHQCGDPHCQEHGDEPKARAQPEPSLLAPVVLGTPD